MTTTPADPKRAKAVPPRTGRESRSKRLTIFILLVLFGSSFAILYFGGVYSSRTEAAYRSIGLFTGNGSWAFEKLNVPRAIKILAIVSPMVTVLGLAELATGAFGPLAILASILLRQRFSRRGLAIIGLTDSSLRFAVAARRSHVPIIFEDSPSPELFAQATNARIAVASLRSTSLSPVRKFLSSLSSRLIGSTQVEKDAFVLPQGVVDLVSFLPSADMQVDLAARLKRLHTPRGSAPVSAQLIMMDRGLAQRLDDYLMFTAAPGGAHARLLDLDALAARLLLTAHPLDVLADAQGQERIHLAFWGFGALGRAVAREAVRLYVTLASLADHRVRISVIDRDPDALRSLLAEDPGIEAVADVKLSATVSIDHAGLTDHEVSLIPENVTAHVIALGDPEAAFALAVTLRRRLLEPAPMLDKFRTLEHNLAPIFVRAQGSSGLGRLLQSGVDHPKVKLDSEIPDGIFALGAPSAVFDPGILIDKNREAAAMTIHEGYRDARAGAATRRDAEIEWRQLPSPIRESNFCALDHLAVKARAVGFRLTDKHVRDRRGYWPPKEQRLLRELEQMEHRRYMAERVVSGWRYAKARCDAVRVHPDLVPWDGLSDEERKLDEEQIRRLANIAEAMKMRLAESFVIGITGHRASHKGIDPAHVKAALNKELSALVRRHADRVPVLLTSLATGTDTWAAEAAWDLGIPFIVPLPLPWETYAEDFGETERRTFCGLIAQAEYYFELPLRAGRVSDLTANRQASPTRNAERRAHQYALAGAYIVQRAHQMIAVWDGEPPAGTGGTAQILSWTPKDMPAEYRSPAFFRHEVRAEEPIVISPFRGGAGTD